MSESVALKVPSLKQQILQRKSSDAPDQELNIAGYIGTHKRCTQLLHLVHLIVSRHSLLSANHAGKLRHFIQTEFVGTENIPFLFALELFVT